MYAYGFIGGGNMAAALIKGLLAKQVCMPGEIIASDVASERRTLLASEYGITVTESNVEVARQAKCLVLAIKPQTLGAVAPELSATLGVEQTVISILAGVRSSVLREKLGGHARVVRAMPNLPATIGKGVTGIAVGEGTPPDAFGEAEALLGTVGATVRLPEELLDAVTAVSGSGPGYLFRIAETLVRAGVEAGLPEEQADLLVRQTLLGAAEMLASSTEKAGELCRKVCSPGGTTLAGLAAMEEAGLDAALARGVLAARDRSRELSSSAS